MSRSLNVFYGNAIVGRIVPDADGRMRFAYATAWAEASDAFPISLSLPLRAATHDVGVAHRFFANLLPEGRVRSLLARRLGVSEDNDLALLARVGAECAGALVILPDGESPATLQQGYRELSMSELATAIHSVGAMASLAGEDKVRLSLAGAQDKLPVLLRDGRLWLPQGARPAVTS